MNPSNAKILLPFIIFAFSFSLHGQNLTLIIKGENSAETKTIDSLGYKKNHESVKTLQTEIFTFQKKIEQKGYIDATSKKLKQKNDSVYKLKFQLNKLYEQIKIKYPSSLIEKKHLKKVSRDYGSNYFIVDFPQIKNSLNYLTEKLADRGDPFINLNLENIQKENNNLLADLKIKENGERKIDSIIIKGYDKFPKAFLKNYAGIKKGDLFSKSDLNKKSKELDNLNFIKVLRDPEIQFTRSKTILYTYLEKRNSNNFEGFLGFSTDEDDQKLKLDGDITLQLTNNLNYGETLGVHYKNNGDEQQHFTAHLKIPYLFNTPIGAQLGLDLYKEDSTYTTNTFDGKLTYQVNSKLELNTGYKQATSTYLLDETAVIIQNNENYNSDFFTIGANYIIRNPENELFPTKTTAELRLGFGKRVSQKYSDIQQQINLDGAHIFNIDPRNSIYLSGTAGFLLSENYLNNELFQYGGIQNARGFEENSLKASIYMGLQTEYRFLLSPNLYAHTIIDYSHLKNDNSETKNDLYGIGFGLGLQTKAGLLKVAFANGKTDGENFKFDNTKVHLSISTSF